MGKGAGENNVVIEFLNAATNVMSLNVCFILCSLPIFTIGASLTALYSVHLKMVKDEESYVMKSFFKSFRANFKQSTFCWCISLIPLVVLSMDKDYYYGKSFLLGSLFQIILLVYFVVFAIVSLYLYPYIARFRDETKECIKKSCLIGFANIKYTLPMLLWSTAAFVLSLLTSKTIVVSSSIWMVGGFSLLAYSNSFFLRKVFSKYEC